MATRNPQKSAAPAQNTMTREQEHIDALAPRRRIADEEPEKMVTVKVPKAFKLHHPAGVITHYEPGVQDMPSSHAQHVYSKANGVELFTAKKAS